MARIQFKVDPLVAQGHRVHLSYDNTRAFERRQVTRTYGPNGTHSRTFSRERMPSAELLTWMTQRCGPRGVLWTTTKADEGINIHFAVAGHAMLFKLTWG
jgi:hypothetical protein